MTQPDAPPRERPSIANAILIATVVAACSASIAWMSMSAGGNAKDFTLPWTASHHLLSGRDPYHEMRPTGVYPFNVPFYYPLPAALLAIPFAPLAASYAGIAFVAISFGIATLTLMRDEPRRIAILLSFPALMAATLGQWSPLLLAATVAPAAQFVVPVKPTLGAAAFLSRPSRLGAILSIAIVIVCFVLDPGWLTAWRSVVAGALSHYSSPVRWAGGAGVVLLAAFIWWRDRDARLLGIMALAPQLPLFYDQLLVTGIARTRLEVAILVAASWVGGLIWVFQGSPNAGSARQASSVILFTVYLPALGVVVWRQWKRWSAKDP